MAKLSIVISAYNEQKKIRACLESAKWADEIIFVDNSSTDKTAKIAKEFTKKIYTAKNDPKKIDLQKNLGIEKATNDWIFLLDADEVITPELKEEIKETIEINNSAVNGYSVPRKNIIFGRWIEYTGWYPDYQLRLFRKGKGKYEETHYHEPIKVAGNTEKLLSNLEHYNYDSVSQFFYRGLQVYAPNEAEELLRKGYVFSYADVIKFPFKEFLSRYFAREGYKDGFHGLVLSLLMAFYHLAVFVYLWEKKKFIDDDAFGTDKFKNEIKEAGKELVFWINKKKIDEEKDMIKKTFLKLKRKLQV